MNIHVDVPPGDRQKVEREVFAQLAAMRMIDRAETVNPQRRGWLGYGLAAAVAAAAVIGFVVMRETKPAEPRTPSLVVTPVGGTSRFTVDEAVIDAGSDTSVQVASADDNATVLLLARGSVDCEVAPRNGRPPFRVVAGDVTVEVVGTRFAVARTGAGVRVDVTHGTVRVRGPAGERLVTGGESWSSVPEPPPAPPPAPAPVEQPENRGPAEKSGKEIVMDPVHAAPHAQVLPRDAFRAAQRLESKDPAKAARAYREIANGKDAWAALALYSLAELHAQTERKAALDELAELDHRFPHAANAEDAAWLRVEVLRGLGKLDDARKAAAQYLQRFPSGTYAKPATRLAAPP